MKHFISATDLLLDSFRLAAKVFDSGFRPHFIVGVWRGGAPVGIAIQEYFAFHGIHTDHIAVRTSSYSGAGQMLPQIQVHGLHYVVENVKAEESLLVVDDVFDSGRSLMALLDALQTQTAGRCPCDIRVACPWYKPGNRQVKIVPDYYLYESNKWLVFPHELQGLSEAELLTGKPELMELSELFTPRQP